VGELRDLLIASSNDGPKIHDDAIALRDLMPQHSDLIAVAHRRHATDNAIRAMTFHEC
jgi:hypothetical protein